MGSVDYKSKLIPALGAVMVGALFSAGCSRTPETTEQGPDPAAAAEFAGSLRDKVTVDAMMGHLQKLQDIADAHDGTRAIGTPGYDASVEYVANALRERGFDVETPEFVARVFKSEPGSVSLGGKTIEARALMYSLGTPPDGVTGPLVARRPTRARAAAPKTTRG